MVSLRNHHSGREEGNCGKINRIRKAQQHGAKRTPRLWAKAKGINDDTQNKWKLYLEIRTHKENGVEDCLKGSVCVAQFSGTLTQEQAEQDAVSYLLAFMSGALVDLANIS